MTETYAQECLKRELARRIQGNPRYSLRSFARSLGMAPSTLSRVLAGKRSFSGKMAADVAARLGLTPRERGFFLDSCGPRDPRRTPPPVRAIDEEMFRVIEDWYHYAILEATFLDDFEPTAAWIASRFGLTRTEAGLALSRLVKLGLLRKDGPTLKKAQSTVWARGRGDETSPTIIRHHKQCLERAMRALEEIPFEERTSTVVAMPIDPEKLPLARKMIEEFSIELCRVLSAGKRRDVFQLAIGFHSLMQRRTSK